MITQNKTKLLLSRCPRLEVIQCAQFQLFDNGPNPGKGKSQHNLKIEIYAGGRLDLFRPYWARTVPLIAPKKVMEWANEERATGGMNDETHGYYVRTFEIATDYAQEDNIEFAKMGHIGAKSENNLRYAGQFVLVVKEKNGPIQCVVYADGEMFGTEVFLYDKFWRPGGKRRKFFGLYDPNNMYARMKQEQEMEAKAVAQSAARGSNIPPVPTDQFTGYGARSPF
ncbi:hypothetical protein [Microvirga sp. 17 mud 1-3]|uniref:hypothetical protein n=1 Tax=Microvirga sp. 17 mud 1-3 TaxID=2082949 RepID=UPI000D6CDF4D|nr:hypothetical protein [Microvirga sp. 17 mud 1-3]AWM86788.1 hypothetical protein C4E04_08675 [Microvirga sp. 17 mud 1-3]